MPTTLESLNSGLHQAFSDNDLVYLIGEDVLDPYGGAFKVSRGLSTKYPDRVLTTPISEAGFVGLAAGMALRGLRPVVEIMFGDFTSLIADQLINHISKFRWMYNNQVHVPMVIRTPMGGRRGYGPTHSQSLEKLYLGVPGLSVIAPTALSGTDDQGSPGDLLYHLITETDDPVLFIENKLEYLLPVQNQNTLNEFTLSIDRPFSSNSMPTYLVSVRSAPAATVSIAAYGYMAELARQAQIRLAYEHEIFAELVIPTQLSPFYIDPIINSALKTGALLTVEEGTLSVGWGAEVLARVSEASTDHSAKTIRLAAKEVPIPASGPLEAGVLPGEERIIQSVIQLMR